MHITKETALDMIDKAKTLGADMSEVYINISKQLKIDVADGKIEALDNISEGGLAIRVIKDKKLGFAYSADFDEQSVEDAILQAINNSKNSDKDDDLDLPSPKPQTSTLDLVDDDIKTRTVNDKTFLALETEKAAFAYDKRIKKAEKISYTDTFSSTTVVNSKGISIEYEKAVCGLFAEVIAEDKNEMETGSWMKFSAKLSELDPGSIGEESAKRAVSMLGAGKEKSGKFHVILSPYASSIILSTISPALSADFVQKGKSLFRSATDKPVASRKFTLIDSGILENGLASVPFDDEGTPTQETVMIKDGIFKNYMHNIYTAKRSKDRSTGNCFRSSFKVQPEIQPTNLYIKPGEKDDKELIGGISKGFLVTTIMGAHTINPISGDFSIGFAGFLIENGKTSRPVRGMTIAGNILELLNHIEEIGSDLMFFPHNGNVGSPSILLSGLSVSGS